MNLPLTPERVRSLCAELGYTAKTAPLTPQMEHYIETHKPRCACSAPGIHHVSGSDWECAHCHELRMESLRERRHGELAARTLLDHEHARMREARKKQIGIDTQAAVR